MSVNDIILADKNLLLIINKDICKVYCFASFIPLILPEIKLANLLPLKPEFKSISGEGYLFWMSNSNGYIYLNCTKISNNITTKVCIDNLKLIEKLKYDIFLPNFSNENNPFNVYILTPISIIKYEIAITINTTAIKNTHTFSLSDHSKLKELYFAGQKTFLSVFDNFNVLVTNAENNTLENTSYTEDKIFNTLDYNLYIQHDKYVRIITWHDKIKSKLKEIPINQNFEISFCAYLEKPDVLFLIYRKPLKFDICIVKDYSTFKWVHDVESSSAKLLLIDNLLYFFHVNDYHNEIGCKILDLNDYIN